MKTTWLKHAYVTVVSALAILVMTVGCGKRDQAQPAAKSSRTALHYSLAVMVPETGNLAFIGQPIRCALSLAAEEQQSKLAEAGVSIDMVFADTQANPREAVTQYGRVVGMGKANGVVTTLSGVIGAISPLAKDEDVLFLALTPDPSFLQENHRGLRILSPLGGLRLAETIKERGYKRVLILHSTDAATMYDVTKVMVPRLQEAGVTLGIDTFDVGQRDFKAVSAKYVGTSWDCLVIHGFGSEQPYVAEACFTHPNLKALPLLLSLGALDVKPELRSRLAGGQFFAPAFLDGSSPVFADFHKRFSAHYPGVTISQSALYAYDAYVLLAEALIRTKSVRSLELKSQLQTPTKALTQEYCFDKDGDFNPDMVLLVIAPDGSFIPARR